MNLEATIRNEIERRGLIPEGTGVVVAVSGGADSVALLRILQPLGIPLSVAHLNHGLRGTDSDEDEAFVRRLAGELDLPCTVKRVDVNALADSRRLSVEMAAREARQAFFAELESVIALAHHADDQIETFVLKLARGAGSSGLAGMAYSQRIGPVRLIRPLLGVNRADIRAWLVENNYTWREDHSNTDEQFQRNRIRHTILPMLEQQLNPAIRENILRTMEILREEDAWMDAMTSTTNPGEVKDLHRAARRRNLRKWLFDQGVEHVSFDAVEAALVLIEKGTGNACHDLDGGWRIVVEYGIPRLENRDKPAEPPAWNLIVERGTGWKRDHSRGIGILPAEASFDARQAGDSPIEVRSFRPGDRMAPLGMTGSRKLQDILTDQKVPRADRSRIPVVVCRNEIIWLPGYRIARGWAVPNERADSIHVRIEQLPDR